MAFEFPNVTEPLKLEDEEKDSSKDVQSSTLDELKMVKETFKKQSGTTRGRRNGVPTFFGL